jgi:hypothetical protein
VATHNSASTTSTLSTTKLSSNKSYAAEIFQQSDLGIRHIENNPGSIEIELNGVGVGFDNICQLPSGFG